MTDHCALIRLSTESMAELLGLRTGARIADARLDRYTNTVDILVRDDPAYPIRPEGGVPMVVPLDEVTAPDPRLYG